MLIKLMFTSTINNMYWVVKETEAQFIVCYYDFCKHKPTDVKVTFNKSKLLGWEYVE